MAIKRINQFPSGSGAITGDDLFLMMDDPSGSGITKSISLDNLIEVIGSGGGSSITISNDGDNRLLTSDGSGNINAESGLLFDGTTFTINSAPVIRSDVSSLPSGSGVEVTNIITVTQETYNNIALESGVLYLISDAKDPVISDVDVIPGSSGNVVNNIVTVTQQVYDNITPESGVVYLISDAEQISQGNATLIDGSGNNYNPGVLTDTVRMSGINTPILTGLSYTDYTLDAGLFINVGDNAITVKHNDANSDAANRFLVPWAGDYVASASGGAFLAVRDKTDNVWRIV